MATNSRPLEEFFALQREEIKSLVKGSAASANQFIGKPPPPSKKVGFASFGEKVSAGLRAGGQQVESDIRTVGAIIDYIRGKEDAAEAKMQRARELEQSYSTILEPFGQFEEFWENKTYSGFLDQSTKAISMTTPQAIFSFASMGTGLLVGFIGKQILSRGGRSYAKKMLLDIQRKKMMSNMGRGPALTRAEQEILDTTYDGLRYANGAFKPGASIEAGNIYALARAESLRLPTIGGITGALTQGEIVGASQSFKEYEDAGYELTAKEAKIALALGFPQAVLDVIGEAAFFAPLFKKATGDLVRKSTVKQILNKTGELSKKDLRVLRKAAGESSAGEFLLDLGKAGAVGFAGSAVAEGFTERAQEEIVIQQRFAIDPEYTRAEARIRGIEALFMGTMAGGARGAPSGVIAEAYKMVSTGGEMQQDLQDQAKAKLTDLNFTGTIDPSNVQLTDNDYEGQIEAMLDPTPKRALVWIPNRTKESIAKILEKFPDANLGVNEAAGGVLIFDADSEVSRQKRDTALENDFTNPETFKNLFNLSALPESGDIVVIAKDAQGRIIDFESVPAEPAAIEAATVNLEANNPNATVTQATEADFIEATSPEAESSQAEESSRRPKPKVKRTEDEDIADGAQTTDPQDLATLEVGDEIDVYNAQGERYKAKVVAVSKSGSVRVINQAGENVLLGNDASATTRNASNPNLLITQVGPQYKQFISRKIKDLTGAELVTFIKKLENTLSNTNPKEGAAVAALIHLNAAKIEQKARVKTRAKIAKAKAKPKAKPKTKAKPKAKAKSIQEFIKKSKPKAKAKPKAKPITRELGEQTRLDRTQYNKFMGPDYVGRGSYQAFISDLRKQGKTQAEINAISLQIREVHVADLQAEYPQLGIKGIEKNGSTLLLTPEGKKLLMRLEPTATRLMVGNHGVYIEMNEPANKGTFVKKRLQYNEYTRDGVKLYDQFKTVNYANYKPGMWYADPRQYAGLKTQPTQTTGPLNIWAGTNENAVLSNLAGRPFTDKNGRSYVSVEHAYQSWKSGEFDADTYNKGWAPGKKIIGRKGTRTEGNWNIQLMERMVRLSFEQNPEAQQALLNTGDATLTHTQDRGVWKNEFPRILMEVRDSLQPTQTTVPNTSPNFVITQPGKVFEKVRGKQIGELSDAQLASFTVLLEKRIEGLNLESLDYTQTLTHLNAAKIERERRASGDKGPGDDEERDKDIAEAMAGSAATAEAIFAEGDSQEGLTIPSEEAIDDDNDGRVFADAGDETLKTDKFVEGTLLFSTPKRALSAYESAELRQKQTPSEQEKQAFLDEIGPQKNIVNFDNVPLNLITEIMEAKEKDPSLDVGIEVQENDAGELAYNARVLSSSFDQNLNVAIQNATNPQHLRDDLRKKYASDTGLDKLPGFNVPKKKIKIEGKEVDFDIKKVPGTKFDPVVRDGVFPENLSPTTIKPDQLYGKTNGVSIIALLEFIIDRDGISKNIPLDARYAQALPTLIADLEAIGRPLHYGMKGEQKHIIEYINSIPEKRSWRAAVINAKNPKVIIAGSREFVNESVMNETLDAEKIIPDDAEIVSGTARGADRTGEAYAGTRGLTLKKMPAVWRPGGVLDRAAGYKRNVQMAEYADALVVFWDGKSKGTLHMIKEALSLGLPVKIFDFNGKSQPLPNVKLKAQDVVIAPIDVKYGPGGTVTNISEKDDGQSRIRFNKDSVRKGVKAPSAEFPEGQNIAAQVPTEELPFFLDQLEKKVGLLISRDALLEEAGLRKEEEKEDGTKRWVETVPENFKELILDYLYENHPELNEARQGAITLDEFAMDERSLYADPGPAQREKIAGELELERDVKQDPVDVLNQTWVNNLQQRAADDVDSSRVITVKYVSGVQAVKTAEANNEGISVLRKYGQGEKHYGNPFSHLPRNKAPDTKKTKDLKDSIFQYEKWLEGTDHTDFKQERRQWVLDQIAEGKLAGKTLLYYTEYREKGDILPTNHAESLKAFAQKNQPTTTTKPLKLQDTTISPTVRDYFNNPDPTKKPSKSADFKNNFAYKLLEVTRSIFKYNRKLTMITPEELIQQTEKDRLSFRGKTLFTFAREMQEKGKLAQYVYLPDTDEDIILIDIKRIRGFSGRVSGLYNQQEIENADLTTAGQQRLDGVSLPVAMLALSHEMGHAVFRVELQLLFKNARGLKFLMDAFEKERDTTTDPKAKARYSGKYGFEEWFADKFATVLLKKIRTGETPKGGDFVSGYFTRLFKKIEQIYEKMRNLVFGERFSETASGFGDFETYVDQVIKNGRTYQSIHDSLQGISFGQEVQVRNLIEETIKVHKKYINKKHLEGVKRKVLQLLRSKIPGQTTDKGYWSVAYAIQTNDGYMRGLVNKLWQFPEAGKDLARQLYSRSSSKDKWGFINARTIVINQNINALLDHKETNGEFAFRDKDDNLDVEKIAEAASLAEDDRVNTEDLSTEGAKAMRRFLQKFYKDYITVKNPNIRYKENFFSRHWLLSEIINSPQLRQKLADLLAKYNPKVKAPKGFESWLAFVEDWAKTDEESDSTGLVSESKDEDASTLSIGMAQERKKYFENIPNIAARRGLDENGNVNPDGDAGLLKSADFAIKSYIENIVKKLEYEDKVRVVPTDWDKAQLENLYGENKAKVLTRLEDGETEVKGWRAAEILLARIEDDASREGARKGLEAQLGKVGVGMSPFMRQLNSWALFGNMVTLLTFAALASLPDLAGPILRSRDMNNKIGTIVEQLQYTIKNRKEAQQFARDLGVVTHEAIETMYINAAELGFMTERSKRWASKFFRITLLEQYTKFTRVFAALMGEQYLIRTAQKAKAGDKTAIRHLEELQRNVTPDEILEWAGSTKKGQRRFDTEGGKKVQEALARFVEESIVRPNAAERPVWASNPYFALVWQLKAFFYAYGKNIVGGAIREGRNKYREDGQLSSRVMPIVIMASLLLPLTAIGLEIREFIKYLSRSAIGDEASAKRAFRSDNMPWGHYMFELLDRSGIYGPLGLLLPMAQAPRYGDAWFLPALGPTAERLDDLLIDRTFMTKDYLPFAASIF